MREEIERYINGQKFGKLELVDKEIFYISFNTRDNETTPAIKFCIYSNTPSRSNPNNITKNTITISSIFIANLISFHNIKTAIIKIKNSAHKGISVPNNTIPTQSIFIKNISLFYIITFFKISSFIIFIPNVLKQLSALPYLCILELNL